MQDDTTPSAAMPDEFDRLMGQLDGLNDVTRTRAATITVVPTLGVGGSQTFIVQTVRQRDTNLDAEQSRSRDTIFLQVVGARGSVRIALPAQVADVIARQRDALGTITRKRVGRDRAAQMKAAGIKPNTAGLEHYPLHSIAGDRMKSEQWIIETWNPNFRRYQLAWKGPKRYAHVMMNKPYFRKWTRRLVKLEVTKTVVTKVVGSPRTF